MTGVQTCALPISAAATWGNAFTGDVADGPCELVYACLNALSAAPARLVYTDDSNKRDNVAFAPATAAGTFLRIPLAEQETASLWASPAVAANFQTQDARITDYGARDVHGFNNTPAAMGGQWVIWGMQPLIEVVYSAAAFAGMRPTNAFSRAVPVPPGATIAVEIGHSLSETAAAAFKDIEVFGRLYDIPA